MVKKTLSLIPLSALLGTLLAAEPGKPPVRCLYPGDCKVDVLGTHVGKCESFSAWKRQYQSATPEERRRMWAAAAMPMDARIKEAYEADEEQGAAISKIVSEELEAHRASMGEASTKASNYRKQMAERLQGLIEAIKEADRKQKNGEQLDQPLPDPEQDPVLLDLDKKIREVDEKYPVNWNKIADRVERTLPADQAERGRLRLSDSTPHLFTARKHEPAPKSSQVGGSSAAQHPWDRYVADYAERYSLDAGQQSSAISILGELKGKAQQIREGLKKELEAADGEAEVAAAQIRFDAFDEIQDQLFGELKERLQGLLTKTQLSMGEPAKKP